MKTREWSDGRPRPSGCQFSSRTAERNQAWTVGDPHRSTGLPEVFLRCLKFNFVGGIGIVVQLAALALFRSALHFDYLPATALAVEIAVIHNFLWHERFTWADRPSERTIHSLGRFAKFNGSSGLVSLVGNLLVMRALVGGVGMNYVAANLIAVATCSLINFLLSDCFVFET